MASLFAGCPCRIPCSWSFLHVGVLLVKLSLGTFAAHFVTNGLLNTGERVEFRGMMICMGRSLEECRKGSR